MENPTLRELRNGAHKTISEVAALLKIEEQTVYRYEQGTRRIDIEQALILSRLYDCPVEEVIEAQLNSCQICQANSLRSQ